MTKYPVSITVNGKLRTAEVSSRTTLADCLREEFGLTGTNVGCEQGVCGACTVIADGVTIRSCLLYAVQAEGMCIESIEGLVQEAGEAFSRLQKAFADEDALQCGFCTPGLLVESSALLDRPVLDEHEVRTALSGNLCRCTGYEGIVRAVVHAARDAGGPQQATTVSDVGERARDGSSSSTRG